MISIRSQKEIAKTSQGVCESVFAVKQTAQMAIYGSNCDIWCQMPGLCITRVSEMLTLSGESEDIEELHAFLQCMGGRIEGSGELITKLLRPEQVRYLPLLSAPAPNEAHYDVVGVPTRLGPVYNLLCMCDTSFHELAYDAWLSDFSHRCRHGFSACYTVEEKGSPCATFSILFSGEGKAIGGGLAVHPNTRGRGYGAMLLQHAANVCAAKGEHLFVFAADNAAKSYYLRRDWTEEGTAATGRL